jgi:L,D-peptidoglycan transpeptidase YkuD (ErfK/YbiS/YcfS/YnhG family)
MNRKHAQRLGYLFFAAMTCLLHGCMQSTKPTQAWASSSQMVLVIVPDWNSDHGSLRTYARSNGVWQAQSEPQPVVVGRAGSAWGQGLNTVPHDGPVKREGDGRAVAGVFRIGDAFGYADHAITALDYRAMHVDDYCIDVPGSPLYNQIVDTRNADPSIVAGSTEPMRRDLHADGDQRYRLGFIIQHNATDTPGAGSCIFAHIWKSSDTPTAGCTAMNGAVMERLLAWLDPKRQPIFVLLPEAMYTRYARTWGLPHPF